MRRQILTVVLAGAMSAAMCVPSFAASSDVNLSIMWWGSDARHEATMKVLDQYTKKTGVQFTPEYTGWDGYWQKLPVLAASNTLTDVMQMDAAYIHQYVDNGQLADLTDYIDLSGVLTDEQLESYKINGGLYGIPLSRNGEGWAYNKTQLDQYGIEEPKSGWTWDEMVDWCKAAREKLPDDVYPLFDLRGWYQYYQEYVQLTGGKKTLDGSTFNFDKDTYISYCNMYDEFVKEGICPPAEVGISFVELDPVNDFFLNKKVLLRSISVGSASTLSELSGGDEVKFVSTPQGDGGSPWEQSTVFFSVAANSEHIQEAADFIKYFITDTDAGKTLTTVRGLPLTDEAYDTFVNDLDVNQLKSMELYQAITADGVNHAPFWDDVPTAFTDWNTEFKAQGEAVQLGQTTAEEAADYLQQLGEEAAANAAG